MMNNLEKKSGHFFTNFQRVGHFALFSLRLRFRVNSSLRGAHTMKELFY